MNNQAKENQSNSKRQLSRKEPQGEPLADIPPQQHRSNQPAEAPSDEMLTIKKRDRRGSACLNFQLEVHVCSPE